MRDGDDALRIGETDARGHAGTAATRSETKIGNEGLRVLLVEDVNALDVILRRHRAVDRDGDGYRVAVLHQRRRVELDLAFAHRRLTREISDRGRHRVGRGARRRLDEMYDAERAD